jgi:hypothetical protein
MSADNGIYLAKFPDGYRVAYGAGTDNLDYFPKGTKERKEELRKFFGKSEVFETRKEASRKAHEMEEKFMKEDDFGVLEDGVCYLGEFESFN